MVSSNTIFWEVDVQNDFMLPEGRLYVPGAEKAIANIELLTNAARQGRVFQISSADAHNASDPELREWPPHCLKGTRGAALLPEGCAAPRLVIPNQKEFVIPRDLRIYRQVTLEKNTLDVFDNPNTDVLLERLKPAGLPAFAGNPKFVVFGVATEYCVRCTAEGLLQRGRDVAIASDAVRAIDAEKGRQVLEDLGSRGATFLTTREALELAGRSQ